MGLLYDRSSTGKSVLPEVLIFSGDDVLLVHGEEEGKEFWWPPGAYWLAEKGCDLDLEQPEQWITRVVKSQIQLEPDRIRLRGVEYIDPNHPPVMVYEVQVKGTPVPSTPHGFDAVQHFALNDLPSSLGRDARHGQWLRGLLTQTKPTISR